MHSKRYESTEVDRKNGYMYPRGLSGPQTVTITKSLKYKEGLLLRCIQHLKSDLINDMDLMRISGTESSSMILIQTAISKVESDASKVPK